MASIELTVELTYLERLGAHLAMAMGSAATLLGFACVPGCGILLVATMSPHLDWLSWWVATACFAFVPVVLLVGAYRGHLASRKKGPPVFRLTPDGIEIKTRTAELKQAWAGIERVSTRLGLLLVYTSRNCAYPLPLRLMDPRQIDGVRAWAESGRLRRLASGR